MEFVLLSYWWYIFEGVGSGGEGRTWVGQKTTCCVALTSGAFRLCALGIIKSGFDLSHKQLKMNTSIRLIVSKDKGCQSANSEVLDLCMCEFDLKRAGATDTPSHDDVLVCSC